MSNIKISEKHGVNPCMVICFFCQEETGEVALLGRLPNGAEAPKKAFLSYEPCPSCKEEFAKGVLIIEVVTQQYGEVRAIQAGAYPTGNYWVVNKDALQDVNSDVLLVTPEIAKASGLYPQE